MNTTLEGGREGLGGRTIERIGESLILCVICQIPNNSREPEREVRRVREQKTNALREIASQEQGERKSYSAQRNSASHCFPPGPSFRFRLDSICGVFQFAILEAKAFA